MKNIDQREWEERVASDSHAIILDVRTPHEFNQGIIKDAFNVDVLHPLKFDAIIDSLDKQNNLYIYCRSGNRSRQACLLLNHLGFKNIFNLTRGIVNWSGVIVLPEH